MTKLRLALLLMLPIGAWAADPALLKLVMPDAKVIAGIQVDQTRNSLFGQYVLSHMRVDDAGFQAFIAQTGFDPRTDVSEILIASNWESADAGSRWLVMARGSFDPGKIASAASGNGITTVNFQGVDILVHSSPAKPEVQNAVAFFDSARAVMGDLASVKAAIERQKSLAPPSNDLVAKVAGLSSKNDFWFATLVPVSEFAGAMPDPNLSGAMKGNLLAAINERRNTFLGPRHHLRRGDYPVGERRAGAGGCREVCRRHDPTQPAEQSRGGTGGHAAG